MPASNRRLISPTGKRKTLSPIHPNVGVEAAYRTRLERLIDEMHRSLVYFLRAQYRANPPLLAQDDDSPAMGLRAEMRSLGRRWQDRFDKLAPELAKHFATSATERADGALASALRRGGMTVRFRMTAAANDVVQAAVGANVSLIKSIASQHLTDVEGAVMRSVQAGRDLGTLAKELEAGYGVTRRRAALISRDQNNKATAAITRVRQQELGITQAIWLHSGGGRHPRPEHVKAGRDRLVYDVARGAFLEGKWTWPGVEIGCRCVAIAIVPGIDD